jgi:hypothetical protein
VNKHSINYSEEDLIEIAVREWVLEWCKKNNPEVFERARQYILQKAKHEGVS